jgi:formamidopyrimidine-DNA glycosylase
VREAEEMPELPDIVAYLSALEPRILDQRLQRVRLNSAFVVRTAQPPMADLHGRTVRELRRIGKRIAIGFDGAGRLHWRAPDASIASRQNLASLDFPLGSLTLTEAGRRHRTSIHVVSGEQQLLSLDPGGIDVFTANLETFRSVLTSENHTLKRALTDPRLLSGIGNAYSDEILHAARLSPLAQTSKLTPDEWERLFAATRGTLELWVKCLLADMGDSFPEKVTAFREGMSVHGRYGEPCPICGNKVLRIRFADNETNYCANCQTGGRILADRSLSRLLGSDWPRTLDELEMLRKR